MKRFISIVLLLAAGLATGCVNIQRADYDKTANSRVHKVALLRIVEPGRPVVMNVGGAAGAFGLVGGVVQANLDESHAKDFKEALDARNVKFAPDLAQSIMELLRSKGFEVVYLEGQRPKLGADGKSVDYSGIQTDADAILNVWFGTNGYVSPSFSGAYQPWVSIGAEVVDARTRQRMYYRIFRSGFTTNIENIEDVGFDERYKFDSAGDLVQSVDKAVEGLKDSYKRVVQRMGSHLK